MTGHYKADVQRRYNDRWGAPPKDALKLRDQGKMPPPALPTAQGQPAGAISANSRSTGMTPQQASLSNAAVPGSMNGNPGIGVPRAETGFSPPPGGGGAPLPPGGVDLSRQYRPQQGGIGRYGQQIREALGARPAMSSGPSPMSTQPTGTPLPPPPAGNQNMMFAGGSEGFYDPTHPAYWKNRQYGERGQGYTLTAPTTETTTTRAQPDAPATTMTTAGKGPTGDEFEQRWGQPRPANWSNWTPAQRARWKAKREVEQGQQQRAESGIGQVTPPPVQEMSQEQAPPPTQEGEPPPTQTTPPPATGQPGNSSDQGYYGPGGNFIGWGDEKADWQNFSNAGGSLEDWVRYSPNPAEGYFNRAGINKPGGLKDEAPPVEGYAGQPVTIPADFAKERMDQYIQNDFLRAIAMDMHDKSTELANALASGAPQGDKHLIDLQRDLDTGTSLLGRYGITYDPKSALSGEGGGGPGNQDPGIGDDRSDLNEGDTDIRTKFDFSVISGDLKRALNRIGIDASKLSDAALLEFATNTGLLENAWQNQQKGINIMQEGLDQTTVEGNPFRAESEAAMLEALRNPDPTDWNAVRNRETSDINKIGAQTFDALNASAARRGLNPGDVAGYGAQLGADQGNLIARRMSELDQQQAVSGRAGLYDALSMAGNVDRNFRGAESVARQMLANAVMGAPSVPQNPYAGVGNTATNMLAIQQAYDAQREAERQADKDRQLGYIQAGLGLAGAGIGAGMFGGGGGGAPMPSPGQINSMYQNWPQ